MNKKIFLTLFLSIITTFLFAQYGTLTVSSNNNQKFWLFIDDVLQNEYSIHSIRITGLQFNSYRIRVEMDNAANNCVGQTVLISNMEINNNFVVSRDRANNYLFGKTRMPVNPIFIQHILLPNYSYYNDYQLYLMPGFNPYANYGQGNQYRGNQYNGYKPNFQGGGNNYGGNQGHGNPGHGNPGGNISYPCMPAANFNNSISIIQKESFENSKLNTAKQIASNNNLCASQIAHICKLFSFEQSKLDFAKYAYRFCVDQNNYYLLNEVFSFAASKDELKKFIEGR